MTQDPTNGSGHPDAQDLDALTGESPEFGEPRSSVLTPMGEVESIGSFARGLGARRLRITLWIGGGLVMTLALLAALN